ncbi:hypothetical protein MRB53_036483 [Persea americana]|nr:hypothetical protein MRB53_037988 [Persea americana]KAJ8614368.1 hypothetical protein MRB53_036566 [Persea americana]KAJ8614817.1 hypothetical protein MRB53_036483 [Persea americana]
MSNLGRGKGLELETPEPPGTIIFPSGGQASGSKIALRTKPTPHERIPGHPHRSNKKERPLLANRNPTLKSWFPIGSVLKVSSFRLTNEPVTVPFLTQVISAIVELANPAHTGVLDGA